MEPKMVQHTLELDPTYKIQTQCGHISVQEWLEKEKARFERGPYPGETDYRKRKGEIRGLPGGKIALFVDKV